MKKAKEAYYYYGYITYQLPGLKFTNLLANAPSIYPSSNTYNIYNVHGQVMKSILPEFWSKRCQNLARQLFQPFMDAFICWNQEI